MKNIIYCYYLLSIFLINIEARQINKLSDLPPASIELVNTKIHICNESCLIGFEREGLIFSLLANARENTSLENKIQYYLKELNITPKELLKKLFEESTAVKEEIDLRILDKITLDNKVLKLALLIPKKNVGKYVHSTTDTILSYLFAREVDFNIKVFDTINDTREHIAAALNTIASMDVDLIMAITSKADNLDVFDQIKVPVFIPTINKEQLADHTTFNNIIFAGISYKKQIETLIKAINHRGIMLTYNDNSNIGNYLKTSVKERYKYVLIEDIIDNKSATNFSNNLAKEEIFLDGSIIFFNTPVVKTGLLLSQINQSNEKPSLILSTQVNYSPALFSLIKGAQMPKFIVASSISKANDRVLEYASLLKGNMEYDWVNYATALSLDIFLGKAGKQRYFKEELEGNQIAYDVNLYELKGNKFIPLKMPSSPKTN